MPGEMGKASLQAEGTHKQRSLGRKELGPSKELKEGQGTFESSSSEDRGV